MRATTTSDWRTNVAQGGSAEPVVPRPEEKRLALEGGERLGVPVAGVDLLPGPDGELVRPGGQRRAGLAGPRRR